MEEDVSVRSYSRVEVSRLAIDTMRQMNRRVLGLSKTLCFVNVLDDDERYVNNGQGNDQ